jgi:NodT family efflux transporter outer membrane factor (OMF) lipoprotein
MGGMRRSLRAVLLAAASAGALAGCSMMPRARPTPPPLPSAWPINAQTPAPDQTQPAALTDWWAGFSDPTLDKLVDEGLTRSPSVRQALLRLKAARAQNRQTFGAFLPEIDATGRVQYTRSIAGPGLFGSTIGGVGGTATITPQKEQAIGSYGPSVSWEIPTFARLEAAAIGAKANTRASVADVRGARAALAGDVANAYIDLRTAQNRLSALREGAVIAQQLADIVKTSAGAGIASPADAADALRQAQTTEASLADAEIAVRVAENQLSLLRGYAPGTEPEGVQAALDTPGPVPTITLAGAPAAPADLVRLRPDIARAEAQAIVAAAQVGASRADLLPRLNLTGSLTTSDNLIGNALSAVTTQAVAAPAITIPLLDWGKRFATIAGNKAQFEIALINYESTVDQGVAEAVAALTQLEQGQMRLTAARAAESAAEITANGFRASYAAGIASLTDRLRSDQQLLDARQQRIQAQSAQAKAAVAVYRAFGGGPPDLSEQR